MTTIMRKTRFQRILRGTVLTALFAVALLAAGPSDLARDCWTITGSDLLVPDGCTYTVTGYQTFCRVRIQGTGVIDIPAGAKLRVMGPLSVSQNGTIQFSGNSGSDGIFEAAADLRMDGTFKVVGSAGGVIESQNCGDVLTMASSGKIEAPNGPLLLSAKLEMDGTVTADGPHTITVSTCGPQAGSSGRWEVTHASGKIKINTTSAVSLDSGQILITAGTFECQQSFATGGGVKMTGGKIEVSVNKSFDATGPYAGP